LTEKGTLYPGVGIICAELEGFCAREPGDPVGVREAESLLKLGIEPELSPLPQSQSGIEGYVQRFPSHDCGLKTVDPRVGRAKRWVDLFHDGGLFMKGDAI
jgi:hypothetical protein